MAERDASLVPVMSAECALAVTRAVNDYEKLIRSVEKGRTAAAATRIFMEEVAYIACVQDHRDLIWVHISPNTEAKSGGASYAIRRDGFAIKERVIGK